MPSDTSFGSAAEALLQRWIEKLRHYPVPKLLNGLCGTLEDLHGPMRLAIIGSTNAGKSTFMNAILGKEIVPTSARVLTYNVNRFSYGDCPRLTVQFKDGSSEQHSFNKLRELVTRCQQTEGLEDRIWYVDVAYPHPLLRRFQIIDTPGLRSCIENDSSKTRELLVNPQSRPHAVVFLFHPYFNSEVISQAEEFHEKCGSLLSGVTAIAALSRADDLEECYAAAEKVVADDLGKHPRLRFTFFRVLSIAAKLSLGGALMDEEGFAALRSISALDPKMRRRLLKAADYFADPDWSPEAGVPPVEVRRRLDDQLTHRGASIACELLDKSPTMTRAQLSAALRDYSRIDELLAIVEQHFGARAQLIKLQAGFASLKKAAWEIIGSTDTRTALLIRTMLAEIESFECRERMCREYAVLLDYYKGTFRLPEHLAEDLLRVTGEYGSSIPARLGVKTNNPNELYNQATSLYHRWQTIAGDFMTRQILRSAAQVIASSYAAIADECLNLAEK